MSSTRFLVNSFASMARPSLVVRLRPKSTSAPFLSCSTATRWGRKATAAAGARLMVAAAAVGGEGVELEVLALRKNGQRNAGEFLRDVEHRIREGHHVTDVNGAEIFLVVGGGAASVERVEHLALHAAALGFHQGVQLGHSSTK